MFPNKYEIGLREYINKFIGPEKLENNKDIVERIGKSLITENDFQTFMALVVDIYETAYLKAVEDYRKPFEELGIDIEMSTETR